MYGCPIWQHCRGSIRNRCETGCCCLWSHIWETEKKEVLALGIERPDALLLLDDRSARRHAVALELKVTGTLGILLLAKEQGKLGAVRPVLDRLQALRFRLNPSTRQSVLALAGEEP